MRWYLSRSGRVEGPHEEAALVDLVRRGEVAPTAQICAEGSTSWGPLLGHPPFAQAVAQQPKPSGVAATMAMPGITPGSMPGMLGALSGPGTPPPHTPAPKSSPQIPLPPVAPSSGGTLPAGGITPAPLGPPSSPGSYPGAPSPFGPGTPPPGGSMPGFGPPSMGGGMTPAPAAAPKKSKMGLLVGGGCALLFVVTACIAGGSFLFFRSGSSAFAARTNTVAEIVRQVAVDGRHDQASEWACVSGDDLRSSPSETRAAMAPLGSQPEIVLTAVDLVAVKDGRVVQALGLVFPDGRVRYSNVRTREMPDYGGALGELYADARRGWSTGRERDAEMLEGVTTFLELLSEDECDLEWVSSADLEGLPTGLRGEIMEGVNARWRRPAST
ncbi:MAG: DUF4339 domain-containing protein [Sandaracinaceae bacterium]|nr:DUF4339 domain-containing protein [Sandaracinaceae bacterium]